jgi:hypothetical protein
MHGKETKVYLGGRDASGDLISVTPEATAATHDTTTMGDDWMEATAGLLDWTLAFEALYNNEAGGIGLQMEDIGGAIVPSIYDGDADAIGDTGMLFPAGVLDTRTQPMSVADMVKLNGNLKGNGRAGLFAKLLHVNAEETGSGEEDSLNNSASSANGGRGNLHVTAITGSWTITIQQSSDNGVGDAWATLIAFTQVTAAGGVTAESKEVTGTVEQYLRVIFTEDVAGSITFVAGFARY